METLTFSAELRSATQACHQRAESAGFVRDLLAGELPRHGFTAMVVQHWHIYQVLEQAAEAMRHQPVAGEFVMDELARLPALRADLAHLLGPDWADRVSPGAATAAYCHRLREVCFGWPAGFVAHHYTRYLGDLSGGQAIRQAAVRAFGFTDGRGVAFYDFPGVDSPAAFKQRYRGLLDRLPYPRIELDRLVSEVRLAYHLNAQVLAELAHETTIGPFSPDVVAQVVRHMNEDHAADSLVIVRALGGARSAVAARMTGLDATGIEFAATVDGTELPVRVPFGRALTARAELRREVVRLYRRACAALGVPPHH